MFSKRQRGKNNYIFSQKRFYQYVSLKKRITKLRPRRVGLVVSVSDSHAVGRGFAPGWVIPKTIIHIVQTDPYMARMR